MADPPRQEMTPRRILCNAESREGLEARTGVVLTHSRFTPLHKTRYGVQEIKVFYCYARKDKSLRDELEIHLSWLKRRYQLTNWHDREILPGDEWEQVIDKNLNTAHIPQFGKKFF